MIIAWMGQGAGARTTMTASSTASPTASGLGNVVAALLR